jgi:hypothetical protein
VVRKMNLGTASRVDWLGPSPHLNYRASELKSTEFALGRHSEQPDFILVLSIKDEFREDITF